MLMCHFLLRINIDCDDVLSLAPNQHDFIKLMIKNKKRITITNYIGIF
jgi:hypothetical protein